MNKNYFLLLIFIGLIHQKHEAQVSFSHRVNPDSIITHPKAIFFKPGFIIKANQKSIFRAFIDANLNGIPDHLENSHSVCNMVIPIVEQSSFFPLTQSEICFVYDEAGNFNTGNNCSIHSRMLKSTDVTSNIELELVNSIQIFPVPTSSFITIAWNEEVYSLLKDMKIISLNNGFSAAVPISNSVYKTSIDLTSQPSGIYYLMVTLKSGSSFSKSIIKL